MQGMFYGAFQGRKRDIRALLSKLGEMRDKYDIKGIIFRDVELPDNWEEMDEKEWVKIQFASHGSMTINYLEYGLFKELGAYMLYVEGFTCTISMNYGNYRTYTYSPYGSLEILSPNTKKEAQELSEKFEKTTGRKSVTRDKQDWRDSHNGNAERLIANEVLPPATAELQDQGTPKALEVLVEQDDVESFARSEASAPELWDWLPNLLHCAHICGAVKIEAHLNELEQAGLAAGKKRKPLTVAQWKKLWTLHDNKDGTYTAMKYKGPFSHAILPEMVGKYKVVKIGSSAFRNCTGLMSITIPESVTDIGNDAFYGCTSLKSVTLPNNITEINWSTFRGCSSLTNITLPKSVTKIGGSAFYGCSSLTSIMIPESVTDIGEDAFSDCTSLMSVTLPNSVTKIYRSTFRGCSSLTNITLPKSVTKIGGSAFYGCSSLTSIMIPKSVTEIGEDAFSDCTSLMSISIPEEITKIGKRVFLRCASLTSITIPKSVTKIGDSAFYGCSSLTSIMIPESVTEIGEDAFNDCTSLMSISIPEEITKIGKRVFWGCASLTSITIPTSVREIGSSAFRDCTSLMSITIPADVMKIDSSAFRHCTSLTSISIPNGVTEIADDAFKNCDSLTIHTPAGSYAEKYAKEQKIPYVND